MTTIPVKLKSTERFEVPTWVVLSSRNPDSMRNSKRFKELREISKKRKEESNDDSNNKSITLNETVKVLGKLIQDETRRSTESFNQSTFT